MDKIKLFFEENNITKKLYSTGNNNESIDGSGVLPSVDKNNSIYIINYIIKLLNKSNINVLDVGSGVGYLTYASQYVDNFNCYSFEGSSNLIQHVICDKERYAIVDLSTKFDNELLYKKFDITTSFEVLEHVHRKHQDIFWENLKYLSNKHLCSIHLANEEHEEHCTIQNLDTWLNYLKDKGNVTVLGLYPQNLDTELHTFRKECNLMHWDCSIFLLIDFYN
jgi:2-polyprenyl-3-methyl-5-hydroxy-6-metoxy-1,4-benzoquinol methylase